ncbi:MAG: YdcF family protein [Trueperaceae bacterium]
MFDIWGLLQPSSLLLLAALAAILALMASRPRLGGMFCALALLLIAVPTVFDVAGRLAWELERRVAAPTALPEQVDGILVLGGAVEWQVSRERKQLNVNQAGERVIAAASLARRYPEARLAFTGVYREDVANEFVAVPTDASLIFGSEYRGRSIEFIGTVRSTYEDALQALDRLSPNAGETWLLVTSAMHMPRALAVFRTLGWRLVPYPVDYRTSGVPGWLNPNPLPGASLARFDEAVREWGAVLVYIQSGRISWP